MNWERRKQSEKWVREKSNEFFKTNSDLTFAEWCYQQGKADERAKTIDEFYNRLLMHKTDINLANNPWNYIELVARKMTNELKEQK